MIFKKYICIHGYIRTLTFSYMFTDDDLYKISIEGTDVLLQMHKAADTCQYEFMPGTRPDLLPYEEQIAKAIVYHNNELEGQG